MTDRPSRPQPLPESGLPPKDPSRRSSHRPLRPRDSMGALNPYQAELDAAHATGYASGLAEGREEALDDLQTLLSRIIEDRFGQLDDAALDCIAEADLSTLKKWIISACAVENLDDLFAR